MLQQERNIGRETNLHHFYSMSFLILSSREKPSFNVLLIPKEAANPTAILTQFLFKEIAQILKRHCLSTQHQSQHRGLRFPNITNVSPRSALTTIRF